MHVQVSQGMVGQGAARRAAGIILEMVKVCMRYEAYMPVLVIRKVSLLLLIYRRVR